MRVLIAGQEPLEGICTSLSSTGLYVVTGTSERLRASALVELALGDGGPRVQLRGRIVGVHRPHGATVQRGFALSLTDAPADLEQRIRDAAPQLPPALKLDVDGGIAWPVSPSGIPAPPPAGDGLARWEGRRWRRAQDSDEAFAALRAELSRGRDPLVLAYEGCVLATGAPHSAEVHPSTLARALEVQILAVEVLSEVELRLARLVFHGRRLEAVHEHLRELLDELGEADHPALAQLRAALARLEELFSRVLALREAWRASAPAERSSKETTRRVRVRRSRPEPRRLWTAAIAALLMVGAVALAMIRAPAPFHEQAPERPELESLLHLLPVTEVATDGRHVTLRLSESFLAAPAEQKLTRLRSTVPELANLRFSTASFVVGGHEIATWRNGLIELTLPAR